MGLLCEFGGHLLECVELVLPATVQLQPHLDAAEDHLLSTLEINSELHNVSIVDGEGFALLGRRAQTNVVQKRSGRTLDILDIPFAVLVPELAVTATNHLTLESNRGG